MPSVPDRPTCIYALCEPGTEVKAGEMPPPDAVRYVGKSVNPQSRYRYHVSVFKRNHRSNWIRKCITAGVRPVLVTIEVVPAGGDWQEAERRWIAEYKSLGARLTNGTIGGEGIIDPTGEIEAKRVAASLAAIRQPEHRAKVREATKARYRRHPEALAKFQAGGRAVADDSERNARRIARMKETKGTEDARRANSERMKAYMNRPDVKAARAAMCAKPETRKKLVAASRKHHDNPESIARRAATFSKTAAQKRAKRLAAAEVGAQMALPLD